VVVAWLASTRRTQLATRSARSSPGIRDPPTKAALKELLHPLSREVRAPERGFVATGDQVHLAVFLGQERTVGTGHAEDFTDH
jgi:hypothetical protein